jgi:hypothetical protein
MSACLEDVHDVAANAPGRARDGNPLVCLHGHSPCHVDHVLVVILMTDADEGM